MIGMRTSLDCVPCFVRQAIEASRMASRDTEVHEQIIREVLSWVSLMDFNGLPITIGQRVHRRLRELTGIEDPYHTAKIACNKMASSFLPELKKVVESAEDPLAMAVRLSIAGNIIDMGVAGSVTEADVRLAIDQAIKEPLLGELERFRKVVANANNILFLADNTGEIFFDRLLIERLLPKQITVAVRGAPVINDATLVDARDASLQEIADIIDNGSDAPGTILDDCSQEFMRCFNEADLVISKGQGNYESLCSSDKNIIFLFKVKCPVISSHIGFPVGTSIIKWNSFLESCPEEAGIS